MAEAQEKTLTKFIVYADIIGLQVIVAGNLTDKQIIHRTRTLKFFRINAGSLLGALHRAMKEGFEFTGKKTFGAVDFHPDKDGALCTFTNFEISQPSRHGKKIRIGAGRRHKKNAVTPA